jgi:16S rRNA (uracil1498-N3)-methyltransferase
MTVLPPDATRLLLDPEAPRAAGQLPLQGDGHLVLAIGPEGGWSPRDRATLQDAGFVGMRLGPRILRTETAGLAAIAALQSRHGDLG